MTEIPAPPSETPAPLSAAERRRNLRRRRRSAKEQIRCVYFTALADGWTQEQLAKVHGVSVATIRREVDLAIAERQVRAPAQHVHLQIARVTKALAMLNIRIDKGEMAAVGPFLKTVAALDRYHGLSAAPRPAEPAPRQQRLPAPPLALTHAALPPDFASTETADVVGEE